MFDQVRLFVQSLLRLRTRYIQPDFRRERAKITTTKSDLHDVTIRGLETHSTLRLQGKQRAVGDLTTVTSADTRRTTCVCPHVTSFYLYEYRTEHSSL